MSVHPVRAFLMRQTSRALSQQPIIIPVRNTGIDIIRGGTLAAMLIVNYPGTDPWSQLRHSPFPGITCADLIAPLFLFLVGISIRYSENRRSERGDSYRQALNHALLRTGKLFALGCLMLSLAYLTPRVGMGTLQRIAICYLIGFLVARASSTAQILTALLLVTMYLLASTLWSQPSWIPGTTLTDWVDIAIIGKHHANGILTTLCAAATTIAGVAFGSQLLRTEGPWRLLVAPLLSLVTGVILSLSPFSVPLSQRYWTPSYAFTSTGLSGMIVISGLLLCRFDLLKRLLTPIESIGRNAIAVYLMTGILDQLLKRVTVAGVTPQQFLTDVGSCGSLIASTIYPTILVSVGLLLARGLARRGIFFRL